jgi:hypothetical protein
MVSSHAQLCPVTLVVLRIAEVQRGFDATTFTETERDTWLEQN